MDTALRRVRAGLLAQGMPNPRLKEEQLDSLFRILQTDALRLLDALEKDGCPASQRLRLSKELAHTLRVIRKMSQDLPTAATMIDAQNATAGKRGSSSQEVPVGPIIIRQNTAHPFMSWAAPLAAAIVKGNGAIVIFAELGHFYGYLRPRLHLSPGQDTYVFGTESELQGGQADFSQLTVVGLSTERTPATALGFQPRLGPVGVIIDQSVLLSSPLPSPLDNPSYTVPQSLVSLVQTVANTFSTSARGDKGSQWASSATPSYLVVHENVLPLVKRALQAHSSDLSTQVHPVKQAGRVLLPARNAASLVYLPIFVMTSLEEILSAPDTLPASTTTYLYGDSGFTSYFTQQYPAESVCINCIPEDKLVSGPYCDVEAYTFSKKKWIFSNGSSPTTEIVSLSEPIGSEPYSQVSRKLIKRRDGFRVDFFFSGVLLSFGTFSTLTLGSLGYMAYKLAIMGYQYVQKAHA